MVKMQMTGPVVPEGDIAEVGMPPSNMVAPPTMLDLNRVFPEVGASIASVRLEIDDAFADMKTFLNREPDEIMRMCGGHSARLSELRVKVQRIEDFHRQWKPIRVRELEPAIEALAYQYQIASRLHSVRDLDWRMETGER